MPTNDGSVTNPSTDQASKSKKGFQPGVSGNPAGRPKGSRNRATLRAEAFLDEHGEEILEKVLQMALEGDRVALKLMVERLLPPRRGRLVHFELPKTETTEQISNAYDAVMAAAADGVITMEDALDFARLLDGKLKALEMTDLADEMREIRQHLEQRR
jgi:hypothetical protein